MKAFISPCPNDTFIFFGLISQKISSPTPLEFSYFDIEVLNQKALAKEPDVCKVSFSILPKLLEDYVLLPCGGALGFGNGPKIVAKNPFPLYELPEKKLAIPGELTTAHALLKSLNLAPKEKIFCRYDDVVRLINQGRVDAGVIIHETRFSLDSLQLSEITDLGNLWEETYHLPLPLGGIVAKKSLGEKTIAELSSAIQTSLQYAWDHTHEVFPFMHEKSIEKDPFIIQSHVDLYVNQETMQYSPEGMKGIETFLSRLI